MGRVWDFRVRFIFSDICIGFRDRENFLHPLKEVGCNSEKSPEIPNQTGWGFSSGVETFFLGHKVLLWFSSHCMLRWLAVVGMMKKF